MALAKKSHDFATLRYETVAEAPPGHREALNYYQHSMPPKEVALLCNMSVEMAEAIQMHPCNAEWLRVQKRGQQAETAGLMRRFDGLVQETVTLHEKMMAAAVHTDPATGEWKPKVKEPTLRRLLEVGYSRDPQRRFLSNSKTTLEGKVNVLATTQVLQLRQECMEEGLHPARVEDAEFDVVDKTGHVVGKLEGPRDYTDDEGDPAP